MITNEVISRPVSSTNDKIVEQIHNENMQKLIKAVNALEAIDRCRTIKGAKVLAKRVRKELGYL